MKVVEKITYMGTDYMADGIMSAAIHLNIKKEDFEICTVKRILLKKKQVFLLVEKKKKHCLPSLGLFQVLDSSTPNDFCAVDINNLATYYPCNVYEVRIDNEKRGLCSLRHLPILF